MNDQRGIEIHLGQFFDHEIAIHQRRTATAVFFGNGHAQIAKRAQAMVVFLGVDAVAVPACGAVPEFPERQFARGILESDLFCR